MTESIRKHAPGTNAEELSEKAKYMIASYSMRFPVVDLSDYKVVTHQNFIRHEVKKGRELNG